MTDPIAAVLRVLVIAALGGLVTKGWLTAEDLEKIITYVVGIGGIAAMSFWAVVRTRLTSLLARVAKAPEVKVVVAEPEVANAVPSDKVIPDDGTADLQ